jgi:hypothetical protein
MLIAEEFLLLALDDISGKWTMAGESLEPALAAALVVELALAERIGVGPRSPGSRGRGRVWIVNPAPTDDPELDALLEVLARRDGAKLTDLISPVSTRRISKGLPDRLIARLVARGVLAVDDRKVLGLFPTRTYPARDPEPEEEVRRRLQAALAGGETPTERTTALIALLNATNHVPKVVHGDKRLLVARAKQLTDGDWAAKAVRDVIEEVWGTIAAITATTAATTAVTT